MKKFTAYLILLCFTVSCIPELVTDEINLKDQNTTGENITPENESNDENSNELADNFSAEEIQNLQAIILDELTAGTSKTWFFYGASFGPSDGATDVSDLKNVTDDEFIFSKLDNAPENYNKGIVEWRPGISVPEGANTVAELAEGTLMEPVTIAFEIGMPSEGKRTVANDKKYESLLASIAPIKDVQEQKRIIYSAYRSFYNKERIEHLLDSLTLGAAKKTLPLATEMTPTSTPKTINQKPTNKAISKSIKEEPKLPIATSAKVVNKNDAIETLDPKINKLFLKKARAQKNNNLVLVNEISLSIERLQKKALQKKSNNTEEQVEQTKELAETQPRTARSKTKRFFEKPNNDEQNVTVAIARNQEPADTPTEADSFASLGFTPSETYSDCEHNIAVLETAIHAAIEAGNYDEADTIRNLIREERKSCSVFKKEVKKKSWGFLTNVKFNSPTKQIDSPRIFF